MAPGATKAGLEEEASARAQTVLVSLECSHVARRIPREWCAQRTLHNCEQRTGG